MQDIKERQATEQNTDKENLEKSKKDFSDSLRQRFHNANKNCTLQQLQRLDKNLKSFAQQIENLFGAESEKVFILFKEIPTESIEDLSQQFESVLQAITKDLKDDIQVLDQQQYKSGYMDIIIKRLQSGKNNKTIDNNDNIVYKSDGETFEKLKETYNKALKDKEAVQKDPETTQHFQTPEYRHRRADIKAEMDAKPEFKANLQAKFGTVAPSTDDLADLVATKIFIQEKGLKTASTDAFQVSYNYLDDVLHFGTYKSSEFSKNDNILQNKSYQNILDKNKTPDYTLDVVATPALKLKALELANKQNPKLFTGDFMSKYQNAIMTNNDDELKNLQEQNPEGTKAINGLLQTIAEAVTRGSRLEGVHVFNGFISSLFDTQNGQTNFGNAVNFKTDSEKMKITEGGRETEFNYKGKNGQFALKDGKAYITSFLNKDEQNKAFKLGLEEIPLPEGARMPSFGEMMTEYNASNPDIFNECFDNITSADNVDSIQDAITKSLKPKLEASIVKITGSLKKAETSRKICERLEKFYCTGELISFYVPPEYSYTFENKINPVISESNNKKNGFYNYLDTIRNTFYDEINAIPASEMVNFTCSMQRIFSDKLVKPEDFFKLFNKGSEQENENGFIRTKSGTDERYIDLARFNEYIKKLSENKKSFV